jgi:hypothetical protein
MRNRQSRHFFEFKHENGIKMGKKYAPATLHSSDLSLGIHCICSQSRDTIPLSINTEKGSYGSYAFHKALTWIPETPPHVPAKLSSQCKAVIALVLHAFVTWRTAKAACPPAPPPTRDCKLKHGWILGLVLTECRKEMNLY